jgi:electron transfer flavoprotein beta subunit
MKILVAVKRVIDPYVKIRVNENQTGVEKAHMKMSMNPFDEIALEQAIRFLEQGLASEVIAVSIGDETCQETLRHALALGASRAILVKNDKKLSSLSIAKILADIVKQEGPELVLMGKQSIDGDNNQTPQMLAGLLDWSQATFASKVVLKDGELEVTREIDGGLETIGMLLPAVVSADLRLNEPRYTALANIMKARQKPLQTVECAKDLLPAEESIEVLSVKAPSMRSAGVKLDSVAALIEKLDEAGVI